MRATLKLIWRRFLRVSLTLIVAAFAAFAVVIGSQQISRLSAAAPDPVAAPLTPVATTPVALSSSYTVERRFIGQVEPRRTVPVSFELGGQLAEILVGEGDAVMAGQPLARLDTRLLQADAERLAASRAALDAQLTFALQTIARQADLNDRGFASTAALDEARARVDELRARIAEVDAGLLSNAIQTEKSTVHAPFDGRVAARFVDGGESVAPGQTMVQIVEQGMPLVRVGLPLDLDAADLAEVVIDIDGQLYPATLSALRPDVDPQTRTRMALFAIDTTTDLAFGQTARLILTETHTETGLWVAATALQEGLRGQWTLLAVDADHIVRAVSVQVVHIADDQVYVRGAFPDGLQLIASGPQRVTVGQTVVPQPAS